MKPEIKYELQEEKKKLYINTLKTIENNINRKLLYSQTNINDIIINYT